MHKLSLAGIYRPIADQEQNIPPAALKQYLQNYPQVNRLVLHLDNDEPPKFGKDVNNDLMEFRKRREEPSR